MKREEAYRLILTCLFGGAALYIGYHLTEAAAESEKFHKWWASLGERYRESIKEALVASQETETKLRAHFVGHDGIVRNLGEYDAGDSEASEKALARAREYFTEGDA